MIELTEQQASELAQLASTPAEFVNPHTHERFVLLRAEEFARLKEGEYDDSPWTREELATLAWQAGVGIGWEDEGMDEYDKLPEAP